MYVYKLDSICLGGWAWCVDQISWLVIFESFFQLLMDLGVQQNLVSCIRWGGWNMMLGSWKTRLFSWLLGGSWQSAVSLRRGPMELYTFRKEMALTWTLLENDGKWMKMIFIVFLPSRKNTPRDFCWIFVDLRLTNSSLSDHSKSRSTGFGVDFLFASVFWLTVVRKSRPVGW